MGRMDESSIPKPQRMIDGYPATRRYASVEEVESENAVTIEGNPVPFGYCNAHWRTMLALMQQGDEIWETLSGVGEYGLSGYGGILLVRGDLVVDSFVTAIGVQ